MNDCLPEEWLRKRVTPGMTRRLALCSLLPILGIAALANAGELENGGGLEQSVPIEQSSARVEDEIGGLIIDSTITLIGHRFHRYLSDYQRLNFPDLGTDLVVHERPSARWGSLVWVTNDRETLFKRFMNPGRNGIQEIAEAAAVQINEKVKQLRMQKLFADTFDLERDEF